MSFSIFLFIILMVKLDEVTFCCLYYNVCRIGQLNGFLRFALTTNFIHFLAGDNIESLQAAQACAGFIQIIYMNDVVRS